MDVELQIWIDSALRAAGGGGAGWGPYPDTKTPLPSSRVSTLCWIVMSSAPSMKIAPPRSARVRGTAESNNGQQPCARMSQHTMSHTWWRGPEKGERGAHFF